MKKILTFLGTITLIGTSSTSLVACNNKTKIHEYTAEELVKLKTENKINTTNQEIKDNLEGITPQEKPFNKVDNKGYFVVGREQGQSNWKITKFKNDKDVIEIENHLKKMFQDLNYGTKIDPIAITLHPGKKYPQFFNSVYCGNLNIQEPDLVVDPYGNIKVKKK